MYFKDTKEFKDATFIFKVCLFVCLFLTRDVGEGIMPLVTPLPRPLLWFQQQHVSVARASFELSKAQGPHLKSGG